MSPKPKPKSPIGGPKRDVPKKVEIRVEHRQNIRCRFCGLTSGYRPGEEKCHYCKQKLFAIDTL